MSRQPALRAESQPHNLRKDAHGLIRVGAKAFLPQRAHAKTLPANLSTTEWTLVLVFRSDGVLGREFSLYIRCTQTENHPHLYRETKKPIWYIIAWMKKEIHLNNHDTEMYVYTELFLHTLDVVHMGGGSTINKVSSSHHLLWRDAPTEPM